MPRAHHLGSVFNFNRGRIAVHRGPRPDVSGKATPRKQLLTFDRDGFLDRNRFAAGSLKAPDGKVIQYAKRPDREMSEANHALAKVAIEFIIEDLARKIADHGREQRQPVESGPLARALRSSENIKWSPEGFTVVIDSVLDESKVGRYYRNLEYGSDVFVGRVIEGFFFGRDGNRLKPTEGARDAVRFIQSRGFHNQGPNEAPPEGQSPAVGRHGDLNPAGRFSQGAGDTHTNSSGGYSPLRHTESARTQGSHPLIAGNAHSGRGRKIIIRNPIPEYEYIRDGLRRFRQAAETEGGLLDEAYGLALEAFRGRGGLVIGRDV